MNLTVAEHGGQPLKGLGGLCQYGYAADGTVKAVGDSHEHFSGLAVTCGDERFVFISEGLVAGLVALDYLSDVLVDYQDMVVFVEDPVFKVPVFRVTQLSVFHAANVTINILCCSRLTFCHKWGNGTGFVIP